MPEFDKDPEGKVKGVVGKAVPIEKSQQPELKKAFDEWQEARKIAVKAVEWEKTAPPAAVLQAQKAAQEANKRAQAAEARFRQLEKVLAAKVKEITPKPAPLKDVLDDHPEQIISKVTALAEHTVAAGETLSHIAQKYYGHTTRPYWMVIYEANKSVIGENPSIIQPGMVFKIPELPAELKDKK